MIPLHLEVVRIIEFFYLSAFSTGEPKSHIKKFFLFINNVLVFQIKLLYEITSDNILKQTIRMPDGKTAYFTREFTETDSKMVSNIQCFVFIKFCELW